MTILAREKRRTALAREAGSQGSGDLGEEKLHSMKDEDQKYTRRC